MQIPTLEEILNGLKGFDLPGTPLSLSKYAKGWVIYYDGMWIDGHVDPSSAVRYFASAMDAIAWLHTKSGINSVEAAEKKSQAVAATTTTKEP